MISDIIPEYYGPVDLDALLMSFVGAALTLGLVFIALFDESANPLVIREFD